MDLFVGQGRSRSVVSVEPSDTPAELMGRAGASGELFADGRDEPLDASATLDSQGVAAGARLFAGTCRRVAVTVSFNGVDKTTDEPPAKALRAILAWATGPNGFGLSDAERATYTFQVCGTQDEPDLSEHVGGLADAACSVCLNLVPQHKFEG